MKQIKTTLLNEMGEQSLSNLMKVTIESPETLVDKDLENVWNKEVERLLFFRFIVKL